MSLLSIIRRPRPKAERIEEDPTGLSRAVLDFNNHIGPAKIFYNRHAKTFYTTCSRPGEDRWWSVNMANGMDSVELYRKTTEWGDQKVTKDALRMMEQEIRPYSVW